MRLGPALLLAFLWLAPGAPAGFRCGTSEGHADGWTAAAALESEACSEEGAACADDLDPCTRDICRTGTCVHEEVPDPEACAPVRAPFRQAVVLADFTIAITDEIEGLTLPDTRRIPALDLTAQLHDGLDAVAAELAGADPTADTAQARARAAFAPAKPLPRLAKRLFRLLRSLKLRGFLPADVADRLTRSADDLRRGVRELKRDVRRLRRSLRTFVR